MGMNSVAWARRIPVAEGPSITAVHGTTLAPLIQSAMLEPANHFPEYQHRLASQLRNRGRDLKTGKRLLVNPRTDAARLAAPHSKINAAAVQCVVAHKTITPPTNVVA